MTLRPNPVATNAILPARRCASAKGAPIGSLHGDLARIAEHVLQSALEGSVLVWVGHDAQVHADGPDAEVAPHSIVGTYSAGVDLDDMIDDLIEARRERVRCGLLD